MNVFDKSNDDSLKTKIDRSITSILSGYLVAGYSSDELEVAYKEFIKDEYNNLNRKENDLYDAKDD